MNNTFWNDRYTMYNDVYGEAPNPFFKKFIDSKKPGRILLPAEGEGRNAIYAASKGWEVDAFDFSDVAREKALAKAAKKGVHIHYDLQDLVTFRAAKKYDAVGLIYVHLPEEQRKTFHNEVYESIESGGFLVLEAFAKQQIHYQSGGPKDPAMLYDAPSICNDFPFLHVLSCGQKEIALEEGEFHKGKGFVIQLIGQKL
ncbi:MAG TPA: class I SAM-dependent methyltransferase [Chitinophagaceae bacterium]